MPNLQVPAVLLVTALLAAAPIARATDQAPMVGGLATSFLMELLVYPAIYLLWNRREIGAAAADPPPGEAASAA